jgi:pimeloyl-ACP methyl ester carboxylesterase
MPFFTRDDVRIHYRIHGPDSGFPVLAIAPGGLRSSIDRWRGQAWDPLQRLADYRVIAMDQRNAGESTGPVSASDGWHTYTRDQLALLDHLGVDDFHVVGMCIGGPYIMGLIAAAPERVRAAVMLQPIGLDDNRQAFLDLFDSWREAIAPDHPEADDAAWTAFRRAMFGGDFLFNASRADAAACHTPVALCMGNDNYHPAAICRELATLLPDVTFIERWKEPEHREVADRTIQAFLASHTPA